MKCFFYIGFILCVINIFGCRGADNPMKVEAYILSREQAFNCLQHPDDNITPKQLVRYRINPDDIHNPYLVVRLKNLSNTSADGVLRCKVPDCVYPMDIPIRAVGPNSTEWAWMVLSLGNASIQIRDAWPAVTWEWHSLKLY